MRPRSRRGADGSIRPPTVGQKGSKTIRQIAALPLRLDADGTLAVLLITSRGTGRWVLPKGNVRKHEEPAAAAAREALEEAGVTGAIGARPVGTYRYAKVRRDGGTVPTRVTVFALAVAEERPIWKEADTRTRRWCTPAEAASLVDEPDLASLLAGIAGSV